MSGKHNPQDTAQRTADAKALGQGWAWSAGRAARIQCGWSREDKERGAAGRSEE